MACHGHGVPSYSSWIPANQERVSLETEGYCNSMLVISTFGISREQKPAPYCEEEYKNKDELL